ncbi:MAG: bifunctional hydroxymethylpyrimidine kinase/phosphomethylpyrimidine kinase [Thermodesulfobacteriota bacterium]
MEPSVASSPLNKMALSVAGSDPSGGAGIQADLKTFATLGVYGGAVITSLTVQNSTGVQSVHHVEAGLVAAQLQAVLADMPVSHIKTGMLGSRATVERLADVFAGFNGELVCDPVLRSTSGSPLVEREAMPAFLGGIVTRATVLTPNAIELETLSGRNCGNEAGIRAACADLLERFPSLRAIAVTGGHTDPDGSAVTDFLGLRSSGDKIDWSKISHPRIATRNGHGTGCTFASAFAAHHLHTGDYRAAFARAVAYVAEALRLSASARMGAGNGPLLHHLVRSS